MRTAIVIADRVTNAKGTFLEGQRISGSASDLQPLVDARAARWETTELPEWPLATSPADYLERFGPGAKNSDLARRHLAAEDG